MDQYGNQPQERRRRADRYVGALPEEPSMSAPKPIPEVSGKKPAARKAAPTAAPAEKQPSLPEQQAYPHQSAWPQGTPAMQDYPAEQGMGDYPQQWPQSAPVQHGTENLPPQQWQQGYGVPQGAQEYPQQWQQGYPAPQAPAEYPQQWSQPFPVQQGAQEYPQQWSQPFPVHQGGYPQEMQGWQGVPANGAAQQPDQSGENAPAEPKKGLAGIPWWVMAMVATVLVAVFSVVMNGVTSLGNQNGVIQEVNAYNDRFCEGVYVDGIHLGGMTRGEALAAVNAHAQERLSTWSISLTYGGQLIRRITAADLDMTVDVNDALDEAWQQGHATTDVAGRKAAMAALENQPYHGYTAQPGGDTTLIDQMLADLAAPVYRTPQDATIVFIPDAHTYPFEITPEVYGTFLDVEPLKAQIYGMVDNMESGTIELTLSSIRPNVTEADLRATRTLRGSATTDISTTSTDERTDNIQRAFQLINGTVLKPGDTFSFNTVVGPRSAKNGFYKAIEYAYGQEREGYGGGVCQASTTVYLAAVRANMTITHREPHSDKVNYTEYGLDATVNLDGKKIDLTFKNTTNSDAYVMAYLVRSGGRWVCHVDIYGEALPTGVTYDLIAETVEIIPAPTEPEWVEDETGTHVMYIDETPKQKRKANDGYVVDTFKVMYLNGEEVERTYVATDTYKAKAQQMWVGIHDR